MIGLREEIILPPTKDKPLKDPITQYANSLKNTMIGAKTSLTLQVHNKTKLPNGQVIKPGDKLLLDKAENKSEKFKSKLKQYWMILKKYN